MPSLPTRIAVIGHVEWVTNAVAIDRVVPGTIVRLRDAFEEPGGGGGVAARVLPALGAGHTRFYTSLADDTEGTRTREVLAAEGVEVCAASRPGRQNRVLTVLAADGERTIFLLGANTHPSLDDPLPWDELGTFHAVFFTGDDARTLVAARRAPVVVVTARRLPALIASGVEVDVLVASANDPNERVDADALPVRPRAIVRTDGARGGTYACADGTVGSWDAAPLTGPLVDSYGAGDTFMAGLTLGLGRGERLPAALAFAARSAARQLVARGAAPAGLAPAH